MTQASYFGEQFVPRRGLRGAHLQTIAANLLPRRNLLPRAEERLFSVEHDVQVLCHCHWQPQRASRMTLVVVHGLEGSSESQYMIGLGSKAWQAGMNVVRMNMRNCGSTEHLGPTLYNSAMSSDVGAVTRALIDEEKLARVGVAGYSMGGNLVMKLAGEWSSESPSEVLGFAAVSPAMDLAASAAALHFPQNRIYEWRFLWGLRRRVLRKAQLFPDRYDPTCLRGLRSVWEFDDRVTAPYCGFRDAADYYEQASSSRVLERIARPTLLIHSADDPFIRLLPETRAKIVSNPHIRFVETRRGGHCAFLASPNGYDGRWAERQVVEFFKRLT